MSEDNDDMAEGLLLNAVVECLRGVAKVAMDRACDHALSAKDRGTYSTVSEAVARLKDEKDFCVAVTKEMEASP